MFILQFEIPGLPPMNSASGMHWRKRKEFKDKWHSWVRLATLRNRPRSPLTRARVTVVRCSTQQPDYANLGEGSKFIIDALTQSHGCGVIEDDSPEYIGRPILEWEKVKRKDQCVRVTVEELRPDEQLPR